MPSVGRKLLMAGRGGLNLTHAEPLPVFLSRYGAARDWLEPVIAAFPPEALIDWCHGLGQPTFTGSSARVFPVAMKASPLLRAWLRRLAELGVGSHAASLDGLGRRRRLCLPTSGVGRRPPAVTVLALGGASWPRLGRMPAGAASAGLRRPRSGQPIAASWSTGRRISATRFAGRPLKRLAIRFGAETGRGEAVITRPAWKAARFTPCPAACASHRRRAAARRSRSTCART